MNSRAGTFSYLLYLVMLVFFAGCTPLTNLGESILRTVGLASGGETRNADAAMMEAMRDLNREEEYYLGRAVAARLLSLFEESEDRALQQYVTKVGLVVARESIRPNTFGGYHFSVLRSDSLNAYAAPGGFIFITEGLLKILPDEDALASILSHEVAHVALRHGEKAISEKSMNDALLGMVELAGTLSCTDIVQQASLIFGAAVDDVVGQLLEKGYSREQEEEADIVGFEAFLRSGYRRESAFEVLAILLAAKSEVEGGWFSSHPQVENRSEALEAVTSAEAIDGQSGYAARKTRFLKHIKNLFE